MTVFVDTSAILAGLDATDDQHQVAAETWKDLIQTETSLLIMRRLALQDAFAFDPHFEEQGFHCLPAAA